MSKNVEQRLRRLASPIPSEHRISYGCINTSDATFLGKLLPRSDELNDGAIYVLPDESTAKEMFPPATETRTSEKTVTSKSDTAERDVGQKIPGREERNQPQRAPGRGLDRRRGEGPQRSEQPSRSRQKSDAHDVRAEPRSAR